MNTVYVAIIPCGNNLTSIQNFLTRSKVNWIQVTDSSQRELSRVTHVLIPGVGAFASGMRNLQESGFVESITKLADQGLPILGICLGMQILFENGTEGDQNTQGLGLFSGTVHKLRAQGHHKIPNVGWRELKEVNASKLIQNQNDNQLFYFLHSFGVVYQEQPFVTATTNHSEEICAIVEKQNVFGVQFHPEKSSFPGSEIISNFLKIGR